MCQVKVFDTKPQIRALYRSYETMREIAALGVNDHEENEGDV